MSFLLAPWLFQGWFYGEPVVAGALLLLPWLHTRVCISTQNDAQPQPTKFWLNWSGVGSSRLIQMWSQDWELFGQRAGGGHSACSFVRSFESGADSPSPVNQPVRSLPYALELPPPSAFPGYGGCCSLWGAVRNYALHLKLLIMGVTSFNNFCKKEEPLVKGRHWEGKLWWRHSAPWTFAEPMLCAWEWGCEPPFPCWAAVWQCHTNMWLWLWPCR